jgi:hypothetical protein
MSDELSKIRSADLQPGTRLRYRNGEHVVLLHRKREDDERHGLPYHAGWWLRDGGGLADFVIDDPESDWTVLG